MDGMRSRQVAGDLGRKGLSDSGGHILSVVGLAHYLCSRMGPLKPRREAGRGGRN